MKKNILTILSIVMILFGCEEIKEDQIQLKITGQVPVQMNIYEKDTLKFNVLSSIYYIQLIEFKEIINNDTINWARFTQKNQLGFERLEMDINLIYNPNSPGEKELELFAQCGDIYTYSYSFKIMVNE